MVGKNKYQMSSEWLYRQYIINHRSSNDIANELGCVGKTVRARLKKCNIPMRSSGESRKKKIDQSWLYEQYIVNEKSASSLAKELGISRQAVFNRLDDYKIPKRNREECFKQGIIIEEDWLREQYIDNKKHHYEIAEEFGCSPSTIYKRLIQYKIPIRDKSETKTGQNNGMWNGGSSFEPYGLDFNEKLKESIRDRDGRVCRVCGKTEDENGARLHVHHIDYDKKNNSPENLIGLCNNCHGHTTINRDDWTVYFSDTPLLNNLSGGTSYK